MKIITDHAVVAHTDFSAITPSVFACRVISDMDEPTNTLMGAHGYCTQASSSSPEKCH